MHSFKTQAIRPQGWNIFLSLLILLFCAEGVKGAPEAKTAERPALAIGESPLDGAFPLVTDSGSAPICIDPGDAEVVETVAKAFAGDIHSVTGAMPEIIETSDAGKLPKYIVLAGTDGMNALIGQLAKAGKLKIDPIHGQWESYRIEAVEHPFAGVDQALVVVGSDRRGTAYGLFELSRQMGISPWAWWADVRPANKKNLYVSAGNFHDGPPSVKYRGIFLNDEDWGLNPWASKTFDPETGNIGPKTYAKIFELLLRLKANYIWPAMHSVSMPFYFYPDNAKVAEQYAIVAGSTHCDMLSRSNVFEWGHNKDSYGGDWRYDTNRDSIYRYWDDRVNEIHQYENTYTIGMRGIHDSSMPGPDDPTAKMHLLEKIIRDQRQILEKRIGRPIETIPQIFVPYKEVLDLYRMNMDLPDDPTIIWPEDNHGYIRQLSDAAERKRKGGSGVYYHFSYLGPPAPYLWLPSVSPNLISYEMTKAFRYGADRLWVFNVGDLKPAELDIDFAMELAWDIDRWPPEKAHDYYREWAGKTFGGEWGAQIGSIMETYYRLAQGGKPEHIALVRYSLEDMNDRLKEYREIAGQAEQIEKKIPQRLKDAYFELVFYPVQAAAAMNEKEFLARKSWIAADAHDDSAALKMADESRDAFMKIQNLTRRYNEDVAGGKWNGIMSWDPGDSSRFQMPPVPDIHVLANDPLPEISVDSARLRSPMALKEGILSGEAATSLSLEKSGAATYEFNSTKAIPGVSLQFLYKTGIKPENAWFVSMNDRRTTNSRWIVAPPDDEAADAEWKWIKTGTVDLQQGENRLTIGQRVPGAKIKAIRFAYPRMPFIAPEASPILTIPAAQFAKQTSAAECHWQSFKSLGVGGGAVGLMPFMFDSLDPARLANAPFLEYEAKIPAGDFMLHCDLLPTLAASSEHGFRIAVAVGNASPQVFDLSREEKDPAWSAAVLQGFVTAACPVHSPGTDGVRIKIYLLDPGMALDRLRVYRAP